MRSTILRSLMLGAAVAALLGTGSGRAEAQSVYFQGYTTGCFNCSNEQLEALETSSFQSSQIGASTTLTYNNSQFAGTTVNGHLPMGGSANGRGAPQESGNFGAFYLTKSTRNYNGNTFSLLVRFLNPVNNLQMFAAILQGKVQGAENGGVDIDFGNNVVTFGSENQYSMRLNDVSVTAPPVGVTHSAVPITGVLTATNVTPEPVSMTLLGTGLLGLGFARRRRRRSHDAVAV